MKSIKKMVQKRHIQLSQKQEKILEYMAENPIHSVSELEYKFNASRTYILELLNLSYTYYLEENDGSDKGILKQEEEINTTISNKIKRSILVLKGKEGKEEKLDTKEDVLSESYDIKNNTDEDMQSEEDPDPLVRTTRLDNMCIMQKNIKRRKRDNIIRIIDAESKNILKHSTLGYNKRCTCSSSSHKMSFKTLQTKLRVLSSKRKVFQNDNDIIIVEKRTNIIEISSDEEVLSTKIKRKKEEASNSILRDTLTKDNVKIKEPTNVQQFVSEYLDSPENDNFTTLILNLTKIFDLKTIDVMGPNDSNVVIIINNCYSQLTDIYVTDAKNNIFEFVTVTYENYSVIYKLFNCIDNDKEPTSFIYHPLNKRLTCHLLKINCCCLINRQKEVQFRFPKELVKFLSIPHRCLPKCSCCCNETKVPNNTDKSRLEVAKDDTNSSSMLLGLGVPNCVSKNPLVEAALKFDKPKNLRHNRFLNKYNYPMNPSDRLSIHFKFMQFTKRNRGVIKENNELIELGTRREVVYHRHDLSVLSNIDRIVLTINKTKSAKIVKPVDCKYCLRHELKGLCALYDINPNVFNYIDGVHNSTIFKLENCKFMEKCTKCSKYGAVYHGNKESAYHKIVSVPIEHIRKAIIGRIFAPKISMVEHMEKKSKTIQEMMLKLEEKFPNISFFINEAGLPGASLPMPYHCYPIEDIKILTQILELGQNNILGQLTLFPAGTEVKLKNIQTNNIYHSQIINSPPIDTVSVSTQTRTKMPDNNCGEEISVQPKAMQSYDFCSILIKCNKTSYIKSFESLIEATIKNESTKKMLLPRISNVCSTSKNKSTDEMLLPIISNVCSTSKNESTEEMLLPIISNVCSLSENDEITKQLYNVAAGEKCMPMLVDNNIDPIPF